MMNPCFPAPTTKTNLPVTDKGFSLVELMIAVAILGILTAIAIPAYRNYITNAKLNAARSVMDQIPVLVETYRADNGIMCPACSANGVYTYSYNETDAGVVAVDTITPNFPGFRAKSSSTTTATPYHYQVVFTVAGCPAACTTSAVTTAIPQANRDAPAGNIVSNTFN